jgi:hemerythrin-like metal-binding protein
MPLVWKPEYHVGIHSVDAQHMALFRCMLRIEEAISRREPAAVMELFGQLRAGSQAHFDHEEALMRQACWPGLQEHAREHEIIMAWLELYESRFGNGPLTSSAGALEFLSSWLCRHILDMDQAPFRYPGCMEAAVPAVLEKA